VSDNIDPDGLGCGQKVSARRAIVGRRAPGAQRERATIVIVVEEVV